MTHVHEGRINGRHADIATAAMHEALKDEFQLHELLKGKTSELENLLAQVIRQALLLGADKELVRSYSTVAITSIERAMMRTVEELTT